VRTQKIVSEFGFTIFNMEALNSFMDECAATGVETGSLRPDSDEKTVEKSPEGRIILGGSHDFEHAGSNTAVGLPGLHKIDVGETVISTHSSCTSGFMIIRLSSGALMGLGKNENGQLGVGDKSTRTSPSKLKMPVTMGKIKKICCGKSHTLVLCTNGQLWGCG
jgi:hypothetical protein